jgi:hypothetical protein
MVSYRSIREEMSCGVLFVFVLCQKDDANRDGREGKKRDVFKESSGRKREKKTGKGKLDKTALRLG